MSENKRNIRGEAEGEAKKASAGDEREYLLSFSSFYKAAYALDILEEAGYRGTLKKLPPELVRSCSTGVYMRTDDMKSAEKILRAKEVYAAGIYLIDRKGTAGGKGNDAGSKRYIRVK